MFSLQTARSLGRTVTTSFGLNLFAARAVFNVPMGVIYRGVLPFVVLNFLALLVITYVPAISTVLIGGGH